LVRSQAATRTVAGGIHGRVHAGQVRRVEIEDQGVIFSKSTRRGPFRTEFDRVRDAQLPDELRALGVEVRFSKSSLGI
jgi:hypothetical protein